MTHKSQLSLFSSCDPLSIRPSWGSSTANLQGAKLLNPWIAYNSNVRPGLASRGVKWNTVLGIGFATALSASIWTGIVMAVAHIWK